MNILDERSGDCTDYIKIEGYNKDHGDIIVHIDQTGGYFKSKKYLITLGGCDFLVEQISKLIRDSKNDIITLPKHMYTIVLFFGNIKFELIFREEYAVISTNITQINQIELDKSNLTIHLY